MQNILVFIEANTTGTGMLALNKAKLCGFSPVFITNNPDRYIGLEKAECSIFTCDTNNIEILYETINNNLEVDKIQGITTTSEFYLEIVSELAHKYSLPRNSVQAIRNCRNKLETRKCLKEGKVRQPKFEEVTSISDINKSLNIIGLPCIVKPVDDSGSNGVRFCKTVAEVKEQTLEILSWKKNSRGQATAQTVLLEEFIDAPEYSVEIFSFEGKGICVGITEKKLIGFPHFVEHQHVFPAKLPIDVTRKIQNTVEDALKAVGITNGPTHTEVKLTPQGCAIIEINARLAGGMIPKLIQISTGIDMLEYQLLLAVGKYKEPILNYQKYAGIKFIVSDLDGILNDIRGIEKVRTLQGVNQVNININRGDKVISPKNAYDRLGYVIVEGNSYEETEARLNKSIEKLEIMVGN
ncbi:ATP-grasp domain-containing protein [Bacillus sp. FSL E2-0195]|uniref:ATP-grasp domain-containing protein n=1 Tax=Bacillus sp. FSL E2-0195 TaxID=2921363 RepID=UPI0030FAA829